MQSNLPIQPGTSKNGATPGGEIRHYRGTSRTPTLFGIVDREINTEVRSNLPIRPGTGESRTTPGGKMRHYSKTPQNAHPIEDRRSEKQHRGAIQPSYSTGDGRE